MFRWMDERLGWSLTTGIGLLPPCAVLALGGFLFLQGASVLREVPLAELASTTWLPGGRHYGMLPLVLGTLATTTLALVLAVPVGVGAALYLTLHAGPRLRTTADAVIALLGGIPSVVVGLWGMTWIVPTFGNTLTAAALVLALMICPTLTLLSGAALRLVPADLVEATRALGVSENITAFVALHHARWGILGATTLAATRGLGEAVAVSMVAGNVGALPDLDGPIATLTTALIVEFDGATGLHRSALHLAALLVLMLVVVVSLSSRTLQRRR